MRERVGMAGSTARRPVRARARALAVLAVVVPASLCLTGVAVGQQPAPGQQRGQVQPPRPVLPVAALQQAANTCFAGLAGGEPKAVDEACSSLLDNQQNRTNLGYQPNQLGHLYSQRALARVRLANFTGAIADHGEAIRLGHNPHINYNNIGIVYSEHLRDPARAEKAFRDALAQKSDFVLARLNLARVLIGTGRIRDAVQELQQALDIAGRDRELNRAVIAQIHGVRAEALYQERRLEEALRDLQEQTRLEPDGIGANLLTAQVLAELGRQGDAERLLRTLADRHPDNVDVLAAVGHGFNFIRLYREGAEQCATARRRDEAHVEAAVCFAVALSALGQFGRAESELKSAVDRAPRNARVLTAFGLLQKRRGKLDEAIATFRSALASDAGTIDARFLLISTMTDRGDLAGALNEASTILSVNERDARALSLRAIMLALNGDGTRALADVDGVRAALGENADYWLARGTVHYYLDQVGEAATALRRAVQLNASSGEAQRFLARTLVKQRNFTEAAQALDRAAALLPFDWQVARTRGLLDLEQGRFETARDFLADSLQLNGTFIEAYVALGRAYEGLGNTRLAEAAYKQAIAAQPLRFDYDNDGRAARIFATRRLEELSRQAAEPPSQPEPPRASEPPRVSEAPRPPGRPEGPSASLPPATEPPPATVRLPVTDRPPATVSPGIGASIGRVETPPAREPASVRPATASAWCSMVRSWSASSRHYTGIRLGLGCGYDN